MLFQRIFNDLRVTNFFPRRFWIAVGNMNFRHTHLDLILPNQHYILEFYFYSYGIKLSKIWRIVLMKADSMLSTSAGSLQDLHNSYSHSFIWKIYQTHLKPQTWCNLFSRWLLGADPRNNQPQVVENSFPVTDALQHFCFTSAWRRSTCFLSNDFFSQSQWNGPK